jgi:valyl-tRNA synthetase
LLERLALIESDVKAAGRVAKLDMLPDRTPELVIACAF